ncbi:hypothetical protein [Delftia sp. JD2]|uniref:hypothetical protein n=1 Tax=Delftia sp. JD2 TaxID=469553 RepID=UPI001111C965|nr:hypothetical protein [Delftia sp. JD2]
MDIARCTEDGQVYRAEVFSSFPSSDLQRMRRQLVCSECNGPAFFRKKSTSGRAACFGARPHRDDCSLKAQDSEQVVEGEGAEEDILNNPGERIVVDIAYGTQQREVHGGGDDVRGRAGRAPRFSGVNPRADARMHRRLSSLLRTLVEAPDFEYSSQLMEVAGLDEITVRDFFVRLLSASRGMRGEVRGWWGTISDANDGKDGDLWINSGERGNFSICVPEEMRNEVARRFRFNENEDLAGAYVLVIGDLRVSKYGKLFCVIDSADHIAIRLT